jgi:hypothetical protein
VPLDKVYSEAERIGGIPTTRPPKGSDQLHHFGNPFTHIPDHPNTITVRDVRTAVEAFDAWVGNKDVWLWKMDKSDKYYELVYGEKPANLFTEEIIHISEI